MNPYRLTWPVNDIPAEIKMLFHPTKEKESQLGMGV